MPINCSLCEIAHLLKNKKISALETVSECLKKIEECEPKIEALLAIDKEGALKRAAELDASGPDQSKPLWGVPVTVKDALSTKGLATTAASRILENFIPVYDAHVVSQLREAGAIILAKANMDEFAMGSSTENSAFKRTRNPWNLEKVPGGSSGGSAASVAARECFGSLGSDTGGSIRQPAAFCGCVGLKPTYGRVSRYGLFAFASSLDQVGPLARTVADCALLLNVIGGHDSRDNTSAMRPMEDFLEPLKETGSQSPLQGIKLGFPAQFFGAGLSDETRNACLAAIEILRKLGAETVEVQLPSPDMASATYYIIAMAEASSNLARYDGVRYGRRASGVSSLDDLYVKSRSEGFGQEVKRRVMLGSYVLSSGYYDAYFHKAAQVRRIIHDQYRQALQKCTAICMPVAPVTAWPLGSHVTDPLKAYLMDAYTLPVNLAGLPSISLPVGLGSETAMPVGMQLVGAPFREADILKISFALERELPPPGEPPLRAFC